LSLGFAAGVRPSWAIAVIPFGTMLKVVVQ
jgi:hypothetical protein